MRRAILPLAAGFGLGVLSILAGYVGHAESVLAEGVRRYCEVPVEARHALRKRIAAAVAPNAIRIDCAADHAADVGLPTPPPAP